MKTRLTAPLMVAILAAGSAPAVAAAPEPDSPQLVNVTPNATDEILANPGMGWETFHQTARQDKSLPSWLPSTVHYARWGWGELEPQPGKLDAAFLDRVLRETRQSGQQLAFRVMCCSTSRNQPYHPAWLASAGGKELECYYDADGPFVIPDLDDPATLQMHLDFIRRLGAKYDGHPDIDHIDLGSMGWWGEWHLSGSKTCKLPSLENRMKVVDAYQAAFKKTPLVMLIGGGECLTYATRHGAGWRADCLGDMGGFSRNWCHMRKGYPVWVCESKLEDVWKTAPVAWESCWDMRKWVGERWPLRYIFNYALALHGSYLNNKSAPLPTRDDVRPEIERFLRRLGYRLVLKRLTHPASVQQGGTLALSMQWQNNGSAPCYRPYRLAYRLTSQKSGEEVKPRVLPSKITVNGWLPGSVDLFTDEFFRSPPDLPDGPIYSVSDTITLPVDLPPGKYTLSIGIVGEELKPIIRLGIAGRDADGWYRLSEMDVIPTPQK